MRKTVGGIEYYVPMGPDINIENWEVVNFLLLAKLHGQRVGNDLNLRISHPLNTSPGPLRITSIFHDVLLDNVDEDRQSPFRMGRLRMEGKGANNQGVDINEMNYRFALLELDLKRPQFNQNMLITLSPVPFGVDGRPKLFLNREGIESFLCAVKMILESSKETVWNSKYIHNAYREMNMPNWKTIKFPGAFITYMGQIGAVSPSADSSGWTPRMSISEFEDIFGVKIPDQY